MKLPKTFVSDKDLNKKIEELNAEEKTLSIEEFLANDVYILFGDTDKYNCRYKNIREEAFMKIVKDTFDGKIKWEKDPVFPEEYKANATIRNHAGKEINIPILFQTEDRFSNTEIIFDRDRWGYLYLGNERGPCMNTYNKEIKRLALEYFKIEFNKPKIKNNR